MAVISPHLDDAVLSLGATLALLADLGVEVTVVTVFGGDPASEAPAGRWDARAGFATEGAATTARREEDAAACAVVGARTVWLPHRDDQYADAPPGPDELTQTLAPPLDGIDLLLLPGWPLSHPDHRAIAGASLDDRFAGCRVGWYLEQPYATARAWTDAIPAGVTWAVQRPSGSARARKASAVRRLRSQLALLGISRACGLPVASRFRIGQLGWPEAVAWRRP